MAQDSVYVAVCAHCGAEILTDHPEGEGECPVCFTRYKLEWPSRHIQHSEPRTITDAYEAPPGELK